LKGNLGDCMLTSHSGKLTNLIPKFSDWVPSKDQAGVSIVRPTPGEMQDTFYLGCTHSKTWQRQRSNLSPQCSLWIAYYFCGIKIGEETILPPSDKQHLFTGSDINPTSMISSPYYQGRQVSTEDLSRCMIVIDIVLVMVNGVDVKDYHG